MPAVVAIETGGRGHDFPGGLTRQVLSCSVIAAFGGLMFGYDIGISGGVTAMDEFLVKFFPKVYYRKHHAHENNYCKFDDQKLQLFTSSLYLAAIVASFIGSITCKFLGRKLTMKFASLFFLSGAILSCAAHNVGMLIGGRMLLGTGVGLANQTVPLFISEIAPAKYRGMLNIIFQLLITIGILCANLLNYVFSKFGGKIGWRLSLGGAAVPALILLFGSFFIVETPISLLQRGKKKEALESLQKVRGRKVDVSREFDELCNAAELAAQQKHSSFRNLMRKRSIPPLTCGTIIHVFQQFTGINVIMFYAPVLFQTMGFGSDAALLSAAVTGGINVLATLIANCFVDKVGRKGLLIQGAVQMIIAQSVIGYLLLNYLKTSNQMPVKEAYIVIAFIAIFVSGFAWSWGPLGWLISSEVYPLETRNAGYFFAVSTNMLCTFIIAQLFLTMLCAMRSFIFFFFVAWLVVMFFFIVFFMPETKKVPVDEMLERVWKKHWFWKSFFSNGSAVVGSSGDGAGESATVERSSVVGAGDSTAVEGSGCGEGGPPVSVPDVDRAEISQEIKEEKSA